MKNNILDEYRSILQSKINADKIFFSPYKKSCLIFYNERDVYKDLYFCDFSIIFFRDEKKWKDGRIFFKKDEIIEISSLNKSFYCWFQNETNACSWSKDGKYCSVSVSVKNNDNSGWFFEAKIIVDIQKTLFTLIPLAGARDYKIKFVDNNNIEISTKKIDWNREYIEILNKKTELKIFKWLSIYELDKLRDLYYNGYFGNIVGYKNEQGNIYFKNSKNEWPYEDLI